MKFYAAENEKGFDNTWSVLVFNSKKSRDKYVIENDGYNHYLQRVVDCRAIRKSQVTEFATNYSITQNRPIKPRPFTGECWLISPHYRDASEISGYVGDVYVGVPGYDAGERLL